MSWIQVSVMFFRLSNAHCRFHEKMLVKKSIISLKIVVTHSTASPIALNEDTVRSKTIFRFSFTACLKRFRIGIRIGSNCL